MEDLFKLLNDTFNTAGYVPIILLVVMLICIVPLIFGIIFLVDSINLMRSSRIVIKGKETVVLDYPCVVEGITQCESSGLIRSYITKPTSSGNRFEPDALRNGAPREEVQGSYNYDETDGIPAVDRPLFKPKDQ